MSDRLAVSAAFSVLMMAAYVLFATPAAYPDASAHEAFGPRVEVGASLNGSTLHFLPTAR